MRRKKSERQKLVIKLDKLAKSLAKHRDGNICQKCDTLCVGKNSHGSHVIPVSHGQNLRWDLLNIKCLCMRCHLYWWHKNPIDASDWFEEKFPDRYAYLQEKKNNGVKFSTVELQEKLDELQKIDSMGVIKAR